MEARIFINFFVVVNYYLVSLSVKFHEASCTRTSHKRVRASFIASVHSSSTLYHFLCDTLDKIFESLETLQHSHLPTSSTKYLKYEILGNSILVLGHAKWPNMLILVTTLDNIKDFYWHARRWCSQCAFRFNW